VHELLELQIGDDPDAWRSAGFGVDDDGRVRIGQVVITLTGADGKRGIRAWAFRGVEATPDGIDGLPTVSGGEIDGATATNPNGCVAIDHVVVLSPDSDRTVEAFVAQGFEARRERETDQYGVPMRQTFFLAGEVIIELIAPIDSGGDGPAKFFGLAYTVGDVDATAALLVDHIGDVKEAVQPGRRITTLRHKPLGLSVATAFMSPEPGQ
jgi:Glyoxalase/Bleomycin resistance protein/Dioxygenase superfamily